MLTPTKPTQKKLATAKNTKVSIESQNPDWYFKALSTTKCEYCGQSDAMHKSNCRVLKMVLTGKIC